ncbi:MAG: FliI/YscN family ATPase [Candidatus Andeanibacterium colombiense]|uniref:FliI/YscN family ATPase n=1 Tax=Candidatus Andeanibacterium colombiense TaxID=3121345 RepID=A0AAJ6BNM2_9SPHN|nr:MAG: FliI/YscN family ATPase [Sphingomonadaceae bacterium]
MKPHRFIARLEAAEFSYAAGSLSRLTGEFFEADGPVASVGDYCEIESIDGGDPAIAEVVAVEHDRIRLVPVAHPPRLSLGATVSAAPQMDLVPVGDAFGGRAIDGLARPLDDGEAILPDRRQTRQGRPLRALARIAPSERLETGVRAIDALLPLGKGQRIGIFAASGVGKTTLLDQIARQTRCDRIVLCLVGERGREVDKLWRMLQASENATRSTLVAATADESASLRLRAIEQAVGLAEHWRDKGEHVLLLVDSVTRVAQALREIGLAAGLPPAMRGLTPNVFSVLPRLVERCGASRGGGAISAVITVLSETDDVDDPVVELMKSVLDGHIVLSRSFAEKRHFPAIDVSRSVSRLADDLLNTDEYGLMRRAHALIATHEEARPMIESGLYRNGASAEIDAAIAIQPTLTEWLCQKAGERSDWAATCASLAKLLGGSTDA